MKVLVNKWEPIAVPGTCFTHTAATGGMGLRKNETFVAWFRSFQKGNAR